MPYCVAESWTPQGKQTTLCFLTQIPRLTAMIGLVPVYVLEVVSGKVQALLIDGIIIHASALSISVNLPGNN